MKCYSTRHPETFVDLKTALLTSLAPDGGLYLPEHVPVVSLRGGPKDQRGNLTFQALALELAQAWFSDDVPADVLNNIVREAFDFDVPIADVGGRRICELFHGPSLSFKDFAAQFLMRLLDYILERDNEEITILTATSGDTGSAVAAACHGRKRIKAYILYPKGRVSNVQEQQIATWGGNVQAVVVPGTFDDCQRIVKEALTMSKLRDPSASPQDDTRTCHPEGAQRLKDLPRFTSANSINIGRLLPQTFYYWWAALQYPDRIFVVPSGNFGNVTAGVLAKKMGAPIKGFVAATNANDAFVRYLASGAYTPGETRQTLSNAMDVGAPSNFERLRYLYNGSTEQMREEIIGVSISDEQTTATIKGVYHEHQYFLDPHTAVAWTAAKHVDRSIVLSTADPAKFPETIQMATGTEPPVPGRLQTSLQKSKSSIELPEATLKQMLATCGFAG